MKKFLAVFVLLLLFSCKKDTVVATNTKAFQESINDMSSDLPTLKQVKFNEALYILKKFAVNGNDDTTELKQLATLLEGKNVDQIMALADQTAAKNGMDWTSSGPPMLGDANIFGNTGAKEADKNDIPADKMDFVVRNIGGDSISGPKGMRIVPRFFDSSGRQVTFRDAALEAVMEVYSTKGKILTSKNLITDNSFRGFALNYSQVRRNEVPNGKIDVKVTVKTAKKTLQFSKLGFIVNNAALAEDAPKAQPAVSAEPNPETATENPQEVPNDQAIQNPENSTKNPENSSDPKLTVAPKDPKVTVSKFLNNLSAKNLKAAYETSKNPNWGSFDSFSNESSGFGAVNSISVKNIGSAVVKGSTAQVDATYDVTDKTGKTTPLKVTFGLVNSESGWKISSYKIK